MPPARSPAAREGLTELLAALRAIRQSRPSEARLILERESVRGPLELLAKTITHEELLAMATLKPLSDQSLRQLLAAEIALERALADKPAEAHGC